MKVRISYIVNADVDLRRAINHHFGHPGLATREDVKSWFRANGESANDDILFDLDQSERIEREKSESTDGH